MILLSIWSVSACLTTGKNFLLFFLLARLPNISGDDDDKVLLRIEVSCFQNEGTGDNRIDLEFLIIDYEENL